MKVHVHNYAIAALVIPHMFERINFGPDYQRGLVWNDLQKARLIDSILRGFDLPKFYFRDSTISEYQFDVVDGQQRLTTIHEFIQGKFALSNESSDLPDFGNLSGMYHENLPIEAVQRLDGYQLQISIISDATNDEIRQLFLRLQEGVSLNSAEKRNAVGGKMRDFIHGIASTFPIFDRLSIKTARFERQDYLSHVVQLELAGGSHDVKAADLMRMYANHDEFDENSKVANKVKKVLRFMEKVFPDEETGLSYKWPFVDLYLVLSKLMDSYSLSSDDASAVRKAFINFEAKRKQVGSSQEKIDALISSNDPIDRDLAHYVGAFKAEGAKRSSIQTRHEVYMKWFLASLTNLEAKDSTRQFTQEERFVIWYKADQHCENPECKKRIELHEMHADHVVPWSAGGKTTLANAQALCMQCNLKKSNR